VARWLGGFRRNSLAAWIIAILLAIAALFIRLSLHGLLGDKAPYTIFFLATAASAALNGFWPGVSTAIAGALLARFVLLPGGWAHLTDPADPMAPVRYLVTGGVVCWICEVLISARERARSAELRLRENESILKKAQAELLLQAEELKRSNRDLEQFAFVASHDMQEPLRTVNIYTELLLRRMEEGRSEELNQFADYIHQGVARMERLIRDLLHFSRVIHGESDSRPADAGAAAREALKVSQALVEQSGAEVTIGALPMVLAGEAHMTQVFQNLLSNAIKYRREDALPRIRISAQLGDGHVLFRVEDNGIGFEPEYAEKVFRLFTRLHGNQYAGSGLGLAICQRIVERYGGSIGAESRVGEGSTFYFTLPAANGAKSHRAG
jgi:light-regulated signal transduction histidine kinase (bacteriophytochrome)